MKKFLLGITAFAAASIGSSANAALIINISGSSGAFGNSSVTCPGDPKPCAFSNVKTFTTPVGYKLISATISSIISGSNQATNIDFTTVSLNGVNFSIVETGTSEFRRLQNLVMSPGGTNTLRVEGLSGGGASYAGTLSLAAVPEPTTWMMFIMGIGVLGVAIRRRRVSTRLAMA